MEALANGESVETVAVKLVTLRGQASRQQVLPSSVIRQHLPPRNLLTIMPEKAEGNMTGLSGYTYVSVQYKVVTAQFTSQPMQISSAMSWT